MKRIITHPEETIYELVASSDCLEFWKSMGFEYNRRALKKMPILGK